MKIKKIVITIMLAFIAIFPLYGKNRSLAITMSLVLPGSGNLYMGNKQSAIYHFGAEALVASGVFLTNSYHNSYIDNAIKFANIYSGAVYRTDNDYLTGLEWYMNNDDYNESVREDARAKYPNNLEQQNAYIAEHSVPDSLGWSWQTKDEMDRFAKLMENSRKIKIATWAIASGFIINRVVSAFITMPEDKSVTVQVTNGLTGIKGAIVYTFK